MARPRTLQQFLIHVLCALTGASQALADGTSKEKLEAKIVFEQIALVSSSDAENSAHTSAFLTVLHPLSPRFSYGLKGGMTGVETANGQTELQLINTLATLNYTVFKSLDSKLVTTLIGVAPTNKASYETDTFRGAMGLAVAGVRLFSNRFGIQVENKSLRNIHDFETSAINVNNYEYINRLEAQLAYAISTHWKGVFGGSHETGWSYHGTRTTPVLGLTAGITYETAKHVAHLAIEKTGEMDRIDGRAFGIERALERDGYKLELNLAMKF